MTSQTQRFHFCPVCHRDSCGHMFQAPVDREVMRKELMKHARTPLDAGVARFTADVLALLTA